MKVVNILVFIHFDFNYINFNFCQANLNRVYIVLVCLLKGVVKNPSWLVHFAQWLLFRLWQIVTNSKKRLDLCKIKIKYKKRFHILKNLIMEHYEYSEKEWECTYWLVMQSCRQCLFETLCRLEKFRSKNN